MALVTPTPASRIGFVRQRQGHSSHKSGAEPATRPLKAVNGRATITEASAFDEPSFCWAIPATGNCGSTSAVHGHPRVYRSGTGQTRIEKVRNAHEAADHQAADDRLFMAASGCTVGQRRSVDSCTFSAYAYPKARSVVTVHWHSTRNTQPCQIGPFAD